MEPRGYKLVSVAVLSVFGLLITALLVSTAAAKAPAIIPADATTTHQVSAGCLAALPTIRWLGQGPGTYVREEEDDVFIVKRLPFTFVLEQGEQNDSGQFVYQAAPKERVWACAGACQLPAVYHAEYEIGTFEAGTLLNLVVIDDDQDERRNWWAADDPAVPYQMVEEQQMVEYLGFTVPYTATWYYYAADSIGIAATCIEAVTSTPTNTPILTDTPTDSPTNTPTLPNTPTNTPTPTYTPVPTTQTPTDTPVTPTNAPTPKNTLIPTNTPTLTTPPALPSQTPTPTSTATLTAIPTKTATPTATPPPPEPPTALDPTEEPKLASPSFVYLPLTMN